MINTLINMIKKYFVSNDDTLYIELVDYREKCLNKHLNDNYNRICEIFYNKYPNSHIEHSYFYNSKDHLNRLKNNLPVFDTCFTGIYEIAAREIDIDNISVSDMINNKFNV